jgi:hypothetical protein
MLIRDVAADRQARAAFRHPRFFSIGVPDPEHAVQHQQIGS